LNCFNGYLCNDKMKHKIFILCLTLITLVATSMSAQSNKKKSKKEEEDATKPRTIITLGHGVGAFANSIYDSIVEWQFKQSSSTLGPYFLKGERIYKNGFGFGINLAYFQLRQEGLIDRFNEFNDQVQGRYTYNTFSVLMRTNYHFTNIFGKFVPYIGLGLGYRYGAVSYKDNWSETDDYGYPNNPLFPLGFDGTLGFRYYVNDQLGIYSEVGIAKSILQFGMSYKFKPQ